MFDKILNHWQKVVEQNSKKWGLDSVLNGNLTLPNYMGYLLETYHETALNPQIQAFSTIFFRNNPRSTIELFYKHAISEIGHDLYAANDLQALGVEEDLIFKSRPLPTTKALIAFVLHQIQFVSPESYLGYLFHLEFLATNQGANWVEVLKSKGVPEDAMSFLLEHAKVDIGHNNFMKKYIEELIQNDTKLDELIYTLEGTVELHAIMILNSFKNGEKLFSKNV